jgi:hypothetical protein
MDLLQLIKLVSIPRWVKFFSLAIIALFMGMAIYAIFGSTHLADGPTLQAGMGLLGILLPLSIAILLLSFYESGIGPLKAATKRVLIELVPGALNHLQPPNGGTESIRVKTIFIPEHTCRYEIRFTEDAVLRMEIELNVKKVTVIFYLHQMTISDLQKIAPHTLEGAQKADYELNTLPIPKQWNGISHHCLVLYKALPADFLWNSAEKLHFSQDLQIMVNSLIWEAGALLLREERREL